MIAQTITHEFDSPSSQTPASIIFVNVQNIPAYRFDLDAALRCAALRITLGITSCTVMAKTDVKLFCTPIPLVFQRSLTVHTQLARRSEPLSMKSLPAERYHDYCWCFSPTHSGYRKGYLVVRLSRRQLRRPALEFWWSFLSPRISSSLTGCASPLRVKRLDNAPASLENGHRVGRARQGKARQPNAPQWPPVMLPFTHSGLLLFALASPRLNRSIHLRRSAPRIFSKNCPGAQQIQGEGGF